MARNSSLHESLLAWLLPAGVGSAVGAGLILVLGQPSPALLERMGEENRNDLPKRPAAISSMPLLSRVGVETQTTPVQAIALPASTQARESPPPNSEIPAAPSPLREEPAWQPLVDDVATKLRQDFPRNTGVPLLYHATLFEDVEWIENLTCKGVPANELTPSDDTALCAAIRQGAAPTVRALLMGGADVNQQGWEKQPPLALASLRRGPDILRALTAAGAPPDTRFNTPVIKPVLDRVIIRDLRHYLENDRGLTPLMACAARGDVEGTTELLRAGAKTGLYTTRYKRYPINFAATQGYLFLMRILLGRQPESEPRILVTIDLKRQKAWLMKEGHIVDSCSVSTGRAGYATPPGRYVITDKHKSWVSTLYHVPMPFFMRLNCSAIGLHSGHVTGRPASHGCIRLPHEKAKKFFSIVGVGDEVEILP